MSHTLHAKLPRDGSIITLITDIGYAQAGGTYLVTLGKRDAHLVNVKTGGGCFERHFLFDRAGFHVEREGWPVGMDLKARRSAEFNAMLGKGV